MFKWGKKGLLFNPSNFKDLWFNEFTQAPNSLFFDNFIRIYFSTRSQMDKNGRSKSLLAYIDINKNNLFDVINISKEPLLPLGELGHFDEFGTYIFAPIRITDKKIMAYYVGVTCPLSVPINASIGLAESFDNGNNFKKVGRGPILGHSLYNPFLVSSHKIRKYNDLYYLFYVSGVKWLVNNEKKEPTYKIKIATSKNGLDWECNNKYIIQEKQENESQACPDVFYKNGKYHMFYCYRKSFDYRKNPKNSYRIGYAYSNDLQNWTRDDEKAGINISFEQDAFDNEMVAYPHIFEVNRNIYMLYVGNEVGRYGIGLAQLEGELL